MGVVLYSLLTGRLPFRATNNFTLIYQITNVEAEPPSAFRPEIPAGLVRGAEAAWVDVVGQRVREHKLDGLVARPEWERLRQGDSAASRSSGGPKDAV